MEYVFCKDGKSISMLYDLCLYFEIMEYIFILHLDYECALGVLCFGV